MKICIISRNFDIAWYPSEIDTFLSGCGECLTYFADSLKNDFGFDVDVFLRAESGIPKPEYICEYKNIKYRDMMFFNASTKYDIYISFRVNLSDDFFKDKKVIYWSSDIEDTSKFNLEIFKHFVFLSKFHQSKQVFPEGVKTSVIPHGVNINSLLENKCEKENGTVLYCSSLDRGFSNLVKNWESINDNFPFYNFTISYGSGTSKKYDRNYKKTDNDIKKLCESMGINFVGDISRKEIEQLYWKSQYWILPLNDEKSELYCLNALKAEICGMTPIINRIGALCESVGPYIDFQDFLKGDLTVRKATRTTEILSWKDVISKYWIPLFEKL